MADIKAIKDYFYNNNLDTDDTFYDSMDYIQHVLCEVLTPSEKARARKSIKQGGFFTFGYNGLACCNSCEDASVKRFFKRNYGLDWEA